MKSRRGVPLSARLSGTRHHRPRHPQNAAARIHLDGSGFTSADLDLGAEGVELAAGIGGIGAHFDEGGIKELDEEVLDGGLETFREMTGAGGGRTRPAIGELLQQAASQRCRWSWTSSDTGAEQGSSWSFDHRAR